VSLNLRANLDPLGAALEKMRRNARSKGRQFGRDQAGFFLRIMRRFSWESAPTRDELRGVYQRLGWRMIRRRGTRTPEAELARRLRARGTFARSWFIAKVTDLGSRIRILLVDRAEYSSVIAARDGTIEKAKTKTLRGWKSKLDRVAKQITSNF